MKNVLIIVLICCATLVSAQTRYCCTYQDFCNNKWEDLDTLFVTQHSKEYQVWWGGNDFVFSCGDKAKDKMLNKDVFVIMYQDSLYVNCRNLRYQGLALGSGYVRAKRIGNRSLLFVNRLTGKEIRNDEIAAGIMFGAIGGVAAARKNMKQQVCYVISQGASEKGKIAIRLVNDDLIEKMLENQGSLLREYYDEHEDNLRILASHVLPILEKSGLIKQK